MPLILAIEPDSRQASLVSDLARGLAGADLILTTTAGEAMKTLETRMPDLILTSTLLSPSDENMLTERLRKLDSAGAHVQILVTPLLAEPQVESQPQTGLLSRLGWRKPKASTPDGCDPAVFAGQITEYLNRAQVLRRAFTQLPPSSIETESRLPLAEVPPAPEPIEIPPAPTTPPAASILLTDPAPVLDLFKVDDLVQPDEPSKVSEPVLSVARPRWAEPLVTDLDALGAELDAVLAAHTEAVDQADPDPVDVAEAPEVTIPEPTIDEPLPDDPLAALPTIRPDLLELLAAIQLDLEPLRSTPDQRASAHTAAGNVQDEWGFFDPQRCGMAALLARLDQMAQQRDAGSGRN